MTLQMIAFQTNSPLVERFQNKLADFQGTYSLLYRQFQRQVVKMKDEKIESLIAEARQNDLKEKLDDLKAQKERKKEAVSA